MRIFGTFGFAALFLFSCEDLRRSVMDGIRAGLVYVQNYSPYSYIGLGVVFAVICLRALVSKPHQMLIE